MARRNLTGRVTVLGFRTDVADLVSAADCFLLCSQTEGLSISTLEAMRAGLPCVVTAVGGNPELVKDGVNGVLVPKSCEGLSDAIRTLDRNPALRRSMGRASAKLLQEEFSVQTMAGRYRHLYSSMLDTP